MNPFMMPMLNLPDVPPQAELWKNEKSKYRHWLVLFGISLIAILSILIASLILNVIHSSSIKEELSNWAKPTELGGKGHVSIPGSVDTSERMNWISKWVDSYWERNLVIIPSIKMSFVLIGMIFYFATLVDSYRNHTFAKLSQWPSMIVGIGALIGLYQLFQLIWSSPDFSYSEGVFNFMNYFIPLVVWVFVSVPVSRIRKTFVISAKVEEIKADPRYQEMLNQSQQQMNNNNMNNMNGNMNMGPFGPMPNNFQQNGASINPNNLNQQMQQQRELTKEEKRELELRKMTLPQLKKVAKEISISGYKEMSKEELIKSILRISDGE